MMDYLPKVSIVIPAYNASNYLTEAIDSALAQTYKNIEIIVVNDGSEDDGATEKIALSYGNKIRYIYKENGGSSSALNIGITIMSGEWFSWLSHDDLYVPEKVEKQVEFLNSFLIPYDNLSKHVLFAASEIINDRGRTIRRPNKSALAKKATTVGKLRGNEYLIAEPTKYSFHGCSCLIHRKAFEDVGLFNESMRLLNDLDMWFRIYSRGYIIHFLPQILVKGRIHKKQISQSIGFSYHNPEQDFFWGRSLDWLLANHPNNDTLLLSFSKNAYMKTRNIEGDKAMERTKLAKIKKLTIKGVCKGKAFLANLIKKMFLKINL